MANDVSADEVEAFDMEDVGDDLDDLPFGHGAGALRSNENLPKLSFMQPHMQPPSRPMTANELEEISLSGARRPQLSLTASATYDEEPPWSPASSLPHIPSMDDDEGLEDIEENAGNLSPSESDKAKAAGCVVM